MKRPSLFFLSILIFGSGMVAWAQRPTKDEAAKLIAEATQDERDAAICEKNERERQIKEYGKPLRKVAIECISGCPRMIAKPVYPETAKRYKLSGDVVVRALVNEEGNVVFAKVIKGKSVFRMAALDAAYASSHDPKIICDGKKIKFWWTIRFHFSSEN